MTNMPRSTPGPSARVSDMSDDVWSVINEAAASTPNQPVVNMAQGFFGYNPPDFIIEAAQEAVSREDCNQYAPTKGRLRLRKAIADTYSPMLGRRLDPETNVTITSGANEGMLSCCMAFLEEGDEVIVFEPFFFEYIFNVQMTGAKLVFVPIKPPKLGDTEVTSAGEWSVDLYVLEQAITSRTKMMIINTPHNPIGKVFTQKELISITNLCVKHNILILSDEVYDRLSYVPFTPVASLSYDVQRLTLTVGSAGKNFQCTGWRIGWITGPETLLQFVSRAHTKLCYSTVSPLQEACAMGFEIAAANGYWETYTRGMKRKIDRFKQVLEQLGLPYTQPEGGYFVMVNLKKVKLPVDYEFPSHVAACRRDFKLAWFLIQEIGLAALPPTEFCSREYGPAVENWMRFVICKTDDTLDSAINRLQRLKQWI